MVKMPLGTPPTRTITIYYADIGAVIASFDAPDIEPTGLSYGGNSLWLVDKNALKVYEIDPDTGTVLNSWSTPASDPAGLCYKDENKIWVGDQGTDRVYARKPSDGSPISDFAVKSNPRGLAWDGNFLYEISAGYQRIYKYTEAGVEQADYIDLFTISPWGLTYDGEHLWLGNAGEGKTDNATSSYIYKITTTGKVVGGFRPPTIVPRGLAWDGKYLWIVGYMGLAGWTIKGRIFKVSPKPFFSTQPLTSIKTVL